MFRKSYVEEWIKRQPFEPFVMVLSSGDRVLVRHPELVFVGPRRVLVVKTNEKGFDSFVDVGIGHIAKIGHNGHADE